MEKSQDNIKFSQQQINTPLSNNRQSSHITLQESVGYNTFCHQLPMLQKLSSTPRNNNHSMILRSTDKTNQFSLGEQYPQQFNAYNKKQSFKLNDSLAFLCSDINPEKDPVLLQNSFDQSFYLANNNNRNNINLNSHCPSADTPSFKRSQNLTNSLQNSKDQSKKNDKRRLDKQITNFQLNDGKQQNIKDNRGQNSDLQKTQQKRFELKDLGEDQSLENSNQFEDEDKKKKNVDPNSENLGCHCRKSKCLKLYCECYAKGIICQDYCKCIDCCNTQEKVGVREKAIQQTLERNPDAFTSKIEVLGSVLEAEKVNQDTQFGYKKGCNCSKTFCRKKYCECYNAGVKCSYICKCVKCLNTQDEDPLSKLPRPQDQSDEELESTIKKKQKLNIHYDDENLQTARKQSLRLANKKDKFDKFVNASNY